MRSLGHGDLVEARGRVGIQAFGEGEGAAEGLDHGDGGKGAPQSLAAVGQQDMAGLARSQLLPVGHQQDGSADSLHPVDELNHVVVGAAVKREEQGGYRGIDHGDGAMEEIAAGEGMCAYRAGLLAFQSPLLGDGVGIASGEDDAVGHRGEALRQSGRGAGKVEAVGENILRMGEQRKEAVILGEMGGDGQDQAQLGSEALGGGNALFLTGAAVQTDLGEGGQAGGSRVGDAAAIPPQSRPRAAIPQTSRPSPD